MAKKDNKISMPQTGAGLVRYFDEESGWSCGGTYYQPRKSPDDPYPQTGILPFLSPPVR